MAQRCPYLTAAQCSVCAEVERLRAENARLREQLNPRLDLETT